jgi:hypothetical protein
VARGCACGEEEGGACGKNERGMCACCEKVGGAWGEEVGIRVASRRACGEEQEARRTSGLRVVSVARKGKEVRGKDMCAQQTSRTFVRRGGERSCGGTCGCGVEVKEACVSRSCA